MIKTEVIVPEAITKKRIRQLRLNDEELDSED